MSVAYCDPNSTVAYTWSDAAGSDHTRVDDGVRNPSSPEISGDGQLCHAGPNDDNEEGVFGVHQPISSGIVTEIKLHAYMAANSSVSTELRVKLNGSWQSAGTASVGDSSAWYTRTYTGSWDASSAIFPLQIGIKPLSIGKTDELNLYGTYVELTYTAAGGGGTHSRILNSTLATADTQGGSGLGQTILLSMKYRRALASALGLPETLAFARQSIYSRTSSSVLGAADLATFARGWLRLISEEFGFSEEFTSGQQQILSRIPVESLPLAEALRRRVEVRRSRSETLDVEDDTRRQTAAVRGVDESLGLSSASKVDSTLARFVLDLLELDDALSASSLRLLLLSEAANFADRAARDALVKRHLHSTFSAIVQRARIAEADRAISNRIDVQDDHEGRHILGNVRPGDAEFESLGPAETTTDSIGTENSSISSLGPGKTKVIPKNSND